MRDFRWSKAVLLLFSSTLVVALLTYPSYYISTLSDPQCQYSYVDYISVICSQGILESCQTCKRSSSTIKDLLIPTGSSALSAPTTTNTLQSVAAERSNNNTGIIVNNTSNTPYNTSFLNRQEYLTLNASAFIDIKSNSSLQLKTFSVAAWFKTGQFFFRGGYHHFIVNKGGLGIEIPGSNMNYGIWMDDREKVRGGFETAAGDNYFVETERRYNDGKWHYAVLTYDNKSLALYIDGNKATSKFTNNAVPDYTGLQPVSIGVNSLTVNGFFSGYIDEIRIWNRTLTHSEIRDQYQFGIVNSTGQVFYMP